MKKSIKKRLSGFTLVEMSISAIVVSIIFIAMLSLLRSSLSTSQKGMTHLTNMETAVIIMSNIEYDLLRARNLVDFKVDDNHLRFALRTADIVDGIKKESWIRYEIDNENGTIYRNMTVPEKVSNRLGKDIKTHIDYEFIKTDNSKIRYGLVVKVVVYNRDYEKDKEKFTLERFILCRCMKTSIVKDFDSDDSSLDVGFGAMVHPGVLE